MRVECGCVRLPQNPAKHPILIRPFNFQFLEFPPLKFRSYQADRQMPAWIVQGLDGNPVLMFPIFIAVRTVPLLQPLQVVRVHIISLPASGQLLINAETGQVGTGQQPTAATPTVRTRSSTDNWLNVIHSSDKDLGL